MSEAPAGVAGDGAAAARTGDETIRVFVRVRPSSRAAGALLDVREGETVLQLRAAGEPGAGAAAHAFRFDKVFGMGAGQEAVFDAVARDAVDAVLGGINATVFAYGQTGSGKTFTVTGGTERYADRGLIPRALERLFAAARARPAAALRLSVSYLELYNEAGFDLLDVADGEPPPGAGAGAGAGAALQEWQKQPPPLPRVTLLEDEAGAVHLRGLSVHGAASEEEALNLLFLGDTNRTIAETPMNLASSRSHCVFTVAVESRVPAPAPPRPTRPRRPPSAAPSCTSWTSPARSARTRRARRARRCARRAASTSRCTFWSSSSSRCTRRGAARARTSRTATRC